MKIPKFTLRDLFWLMLVVGMALALGLQRWNLAERENLVAKREAQIKADKRFMGDHYDRSFYRLVQRQLEVDSKRVELGLPRVEWGAIPPEIPED